MAVGTPCLLPLDLLPMSDQHFFLKVINILNLLKLMKRSRHLLLIFLICRLQMFFNGLILLYYIDLISYFLFADFPLSLKGLFFALTLIYDVRVDCFYLSASICNQRWEIFDVIRRVTTVHYLNFAEV